MRQAHRSFSIACWLAWLTGVLMFAIPDPTQLNFLRRVAIPYNCILSLLSLLPLQPVFLVAGILRRRSRAELLETIALFVLTALAHLAYIALCIYLTGGV